MRLTHHVAALLRRTPAAGLQRGAGRLMRRNSRRGSIRPLPEAKRKGAVPPCPNWGWIHEEPICRAHQATCRLLRQEHKGAVPEGHSYPSFLVHRVLAEKRHQKNGALRPRSSKAVPKRLRTPSAYRSRTRSASRSRLYYPPPSRPCSPQKPGYADNHHRSQNPF